MFYQRCALNSLTLLCKEARCCGAVSCRPRASRVAASPATPASAPPSAAHSAHSPPPRPTVSRRRISYFSLITFALCFRFILLNQDPDWDTGILMNPDPDPVPVAAFGSGSRQRPIMTKKFYTFIIGNFFHQKPLRSDSST